MTDTRVRRKFHMFTLTEVGEIVRAVHIKEAGPSPLILGSRLGAGHTPDPATVSWFQTYVDNESWELVYVVVVMIVTSGISAGWWSMLTGRGRASAQRQKPPRCWFQRPMVCSVALTLVGVAYWHDVTTCILTNV